MSVPKLYYNMGLIFYVKGDYESAEMFWSKVLSINPEHELSRKALSGLLSSINGK